MLRMGRGSGPMRQPRHFAGRHRYSSAGSRLRCTSRPYWPKQTTLKPQPLRKRLDWQQRETTRGACRKPSKLKELREDGKEEPRASTTDADARVMKMGDGGFRPAYNVQLATAGSPMGGPRTIVGLRVTGYNRKRSSTIFPGCILKNFIYFFICARQNSGSDQNDMECILFL